MKKYFDTYIKPLNDKLKLSIKASHKIDIVGGKHVITKTSR